MICGKQILKLQEHNLYRLRLAKHFQGLHLLSSSPFLPHLLFPRLTFFMPSLTLSFFPVPVPLLQNEEQGQTERSKRAFVLFPIIIIIPLAIFHPSVAVSPLHPWRTQQLSSQGHYRNTHMPYTPLHKERNSHLMTNLEGQTRKMWVRCLVCVPSKRQKRKWEAKTGCGGGAGARVMHSWHWRPSFPRTWQHHNGHTAPSATPADEK